MKKRNETIRMLVLSAMFAALCCVTTMLVQFPTVAGYTNIGEGMCLLAGLVLGPWYGFFAAGIGSGLADLLVRLSSRALWRWWLRCCCGRC